MDENGIVESLHKRALIAGCAERSRMIADYCQLGLPGVFAEFGVYRGGILTLLTYYAKQQQKQVHGYDTFTGLPSFSKNDRVGGFFRKGRMARTMESVKNTVNTSGGFVDTLYLHAGVFGRTSRLHFTNCALVHIDFDLYDGTLNACKKVWPTLVRNGVMLVHDYHHPELPGVKIAVDKFTSQLPRKSFVQDYQHQCAVLRKI